MKLATATTHEVARPLRVLAPLIKAELEAGDNAGIEHYRRAGEMLLEAKEQVGRGAWGGWLTRNFHLSSASAYRYMKLAEVTQNSRRREFSTMSEVVSPHRAHHQVPWQRPVQEILARVNVEALMQERQNEQREQKMVHALGQQLIDIGFKALSAKLHPDKGGSSEAMARLNKVRSILKGSI